MYNGTYKLVKNIRKGEILMSANHKPAKVLCVVNKNCSDQKTIELVKIG